ncbi:MAG: HU domain-containing protein, partial [Promethearchaeia archaeon]
MQTWLAFCKWIVERFDKGKGVSIINFLRLSWQHDAIEQEIYGGTARTALKPVWRVAES